MERPGALNDARFDYKTLAPPLAKFLAGQAERMINSACYKERALT